MSERTIKVWGKPIKIETDQLSETKWRASGEYMGESYQRPKIGLRALP